jgi:hypothetical protein
VHVTQSRKLVLDSKQWLMVQHSVVMSVLVWELWQEAQTDWWTVRRACALLLLSAGWHNAGAMLHSGHGSGRPGADARLAHSSLQVRCTYSTTPECVGWLARLCLAADSHTC